MKILSVPSQCYLLLVLLTAASRFAAAQECTTCQSTQDCNNDGVTNGQVCIVEREQCATPDAADASLFVFSLGCSCRNGEECVSGRCEGGIFTGTCQAKLVDGESCNEDSDCISGQCSLGFRCVIPSTAAPTPLRGIPTPSPVPNNGENNEDKGIGGDEPEDIPNLTSQPGNDDDDDDDPLLLVAFLLGGGFALFLVLCCCTSTKDSVDGRRRPCFGYCSPDCDPIVCDCRDCCDCMCSGLLNAASS